LLIKRIATMMSVDAYRTNSHSERKWQVAVVKNSATFCGWQLNWYLRNYDELKGAIFHVIMRNSHPQFPRSYRLQVVLAEMYGLGQKYSETTIFIILKFLA